MTPKQIRKRYVRVVNYGDVWVTYLQIDHQGFEVVRDTTKARASWFAKMLSIALARMADRLREGK